MVILPACQPTFPVLAPLLDRNRKPHLDQTQHVPIDDTPGHTLHQFTVWNGVEGLYDTLPITRTFPKESRLSVLVIRSKVDHSPFLQRSIGTADCFSF